MGPAIHRQNLAIDLKEITAGYGGRPVLRSVSARVRQGEVIGISGPNGAGKTTLLRIVMGLLVPSRGQVRLLGRPLADSRSRHWARRQVGYVAQEQVPGDLPISVFDAVLLGRWGRTFAGWRRPGPGDRAAVLRWVEWVNLSAKLHRDVRTLSGGQRQRVALARALAGEPQVLILDEPTTHLDAEAQHGIVALLEDLKREVRVTTLVVTHDPSLIKECADRWWHVDGGQLAEAACLAPPSPLKEGEHV